MPKHIPQTRRRLPGIKSGDLTLRLGRETDIEAVLAFFKANRKHLQPFMPILPKGFYTRDFWKMRLQKSLDEYHSRKSLRLFLVRESAGEVVGTINFSEFVRGAFHACYLGYNLAVKEQGKGVMTRSLQVAISFVFRNLNMHRIMANYMPRNERSGNLLRRVGFRIEGIAHDYLQIQGKWEDHVLTSLTNPDWKPDKT